MAYQSLYRRYRPRRFSELLGQEHVVRSLQNAVREQRVGHAYLFSGPRGTGKTSTARILARALNCLDLGDDGEPCGTCTSCESFDSGASADLHELDAASNNKVDDIRDLIGKVALGSPGRTKVYVLDEVHMLTTGAENALLKTLEEPPGHVVFVLCTTEPHKVVATIRSRTQHLEFGLLPSEVLADHVRWVADDAALDVDEEALDAAVRMGGGSARDTLSALDQVASAGGTAATSTQGDDVIEALAGGDAGAAFLAVQEGLRSGQDPRVLGEALLGRFRNAFIVAMRADLSLMTEAEQTEAARVAERMNAASITRALEMLGKALVDMRTAPDPRVDLEVAVMRLARDDLRNDVTELAERVARLERSATSDSTEDRPARRTEPASPRPRSTTRQEEAKGRIAEARSRLARSKQEPSSDTAKPDAETEEPATTAAAAKNQPTLGALRRRGLLPPEQTPEEPAAPELTLAPEPESTAAPPAPESADMSEPAAPEPEPATTPKATSTTDGLPTREEATLAWGDGLLANLPKKSKARFSGGRFLPSDPDALVFGLPGETHRNRCEEVRDSVDAALAAHFGRPVTLRLVVDEGQTAEPVDLTGPTTPRAATANNSANQGSDHPDDPEDEDQEMDDNDPVSLLMETFPGSKLRTAGEDE